MIVASASQVKNAFGKYLELSRIYGEVQIERYGEIIAKLVGVVEPLPTKKPEENEETKESL